MSNEPEDNMISGSDEPDRYNAIVRLGMPVAWRFRMRHDGPEAGWGLSNFHEKWMDEPHVECEALYSKRSTN